ncbi:unnamed protein product [Allacma fusca]|uniref:Uncharacterized protein n=1 Tax=Allacma fusca TaxID=39272 RepID=A0A8J2NXZ4_9HEXA|nr:unnamed protein product [Allacma fusca]
MEESEPVHQEDDFDAFNDETFGDGGEYNWEANQALGTDLFTNDLSNGSKQRQAKVDQQSIDNYDLGLGRPAFEEYEHYEGQSREYDDLENNENALEESISRLVLDDFEEDEEAISNDKLRRIAAANRSSYAVFMPPQVVNRHLQWFMDKDLPGGSSLLGSSVWSMHPTSITPKAPELDVGSTILNDTSSHQKPLETSERNNLDVVSSSASALTAGSDLGSLLNLTQQKDSSASVRPPPGLNTVTPTFKTVDEIEQELLRESEMRQKSAEAKKKATDSGKPKILSLEELERELIQGSPVVPNAAITSVQAQTNLSGVRPSGPQMTGHAERNQQFDANRMPFPFAGVQPSSHPSQAVASTVPITSTSGTGPMGYLRHGINARPVHPRPMVFPHNNFSQNLMNTPAIAAHQAAALQQLHNLRQQQQQQLQFLQINPNSHTFRPVGYPMPPNQRNNVPVGYPVGPFQMNNAGQRKLDTKTEDRDVALMTEKDKQRLKNIQIVQLQNDHPHTTDYYCLMRRVRLGGSGQPPMDLLRMLFPKRTEEEDNNRRHYEPAHFENSLGKLQAQSALAPKKAIDTVIRVTDSGPVAGKKKYRYLLLEIEKIYDCLLALEEADLRVALQTNGNAADEKELKALRAKVEHVLQDPKKLTEVMSVRKGKFLVCRLVALIDQPARMVALMHLFKTFPSWSVSKSAPVSSGSAELVELFPYIRHCILNMDARSVESLIVELREELIESMITTKLGISLLMVLLHQGEKLISSSQVTDQFKTLWNRLCVIPILSALLRYKQTVVPPVEIYNIGLQRLLTSEVHRLSLQIKDELTKLLNGFLSAGTKLIKQDY